MLGEIVASATVFPHLYVYCHIYTSAVSPATPAADLGDFDNGVYDVMKIIIGESNLDLGLLTQQTFCFSLDIPATAMLIIDDVVSNFCRADTSSY